MSCILTAAIASDCRDNVGGVSRVWAIEVDSVGGYTETAGEIADFATLLGGDMFSWGFAKNSAGFSESFQSTLENGTTAYQHMLELSFWKWETTKRNEIKIAATTPLFFVVKDNNEQYWALGLTRGLDMQSGSEATSGKLLGDKNGYTLQFMGEEPQPVIEITDDDFINELNA